MNENTITKEQILGDIRQSKEDFAAGKFQDASKAMDEILMKMGVMTRMYEEEIYEQLAVARRHAEEGRTMDAKLVSSNIRARYGL